MNLEKFTERSRGFIQAAQTIAMRESHQRLAPEHLLKALMDDEQGLASNLITRAGGQPARVVETLEQKLSKIPKVGGDAGQVYLDPATGKVLDEAEKIAKKAGDSFVPVERILMALGIEKSGAKQALESGGVTPQTLNEAINDIRKGRTADSANAEEGYDALKKYARDLTEAAEQGKIDPIIGRDDEIRRSMQVLSRRTKNNPVLIGEPGVGKTAIAEGLALRIINGDVPESLRNKRLLALDMGARISGVAVTERGEPIEGTELSVRATNDTRFWMSGGQAQETESNEDGHFEVRGIPAGEVRLSGRLKGRKNPESLEVEVMDGEERGGYELVFTDGLSIHGFVLWPDGTPVNEARVGLETRADGGGERWRRNANRLWVTTDEEGAFALTGLVPGTYRVRANHESQEGEDSLGRWRGVMEGVSAGTSGVEVRLEEPGVVSGRVVKTDGTLLEEEEADRIAITLSTVSESDASIRSAHGSLYRRGDVEEDGTFRITGIYAAEYNVNIDSDKFVHAEPDQRHIHPSGELIVQVSRGASITGVVLDPSGAPVESCEVTASTGEEPSRGWGGGGTAISVCALPCMNSRDEFAKILPALPGQRFRREHFSILCSLGHTDFSSRG